LGLFFNEQCMKWRRFSQNASFHLKGKGGKNLCHSSNQSSICNLFNQVLNCNFDLTINAIASLPKIKQRPWSWPPFSLWSLVLNLCNLTLNWSINF
jgi:hypothetical protein